VRGGLGMFGPEEFPSQASVYLAAVRVPPRSEQKVSAVLSHPHRDERFAYAPLALAGRMGRLQNIPVGCDQLGVVQSSAIVKGRTRLRRLDLVKFYGLLGHSESRRNFLVLNTPRPETEDFARAATRETQGT
jgi:hypothetical protein